TRLRLEENGQPHIPGGIAIWKNLFVEHPDDEYDKNLTRLAVMWDEPDDILEALFALCRKPVGNEPLKIYLAIADINRRRTHPLEPATVDRLARAYHELGAQYTIFTESGSLSDQTITAFLDRVEQIEDIGNKTVRANAAGSMQALVSLWQIFVRNGAIPDSEVDTTLAAIIGGFENPKELWEVYDAAASGMKTLLAATPSQGDLSLQDRVIDLLAGSPNPADAESHQLVIQDLIRFFEAQKLIPLDHIFALTDHLKELESGTAQPDTALVNRIATRLEEVNLPREGLSNVERTSLSFGYWPEKHLQAQRKMKLRSD
ncbi:MAG: hypothetical protein GY953_55965, partial [bacterium]|nr:hypothetical protein [bacterium]